VPLALCRSQVDCLRGLNAKAVRKFGQPFFWGNHILTKSQIYCTLYLWMYYWTRAQ
jgi:hypothetical protein